MFKKKIVFAILVFVFLVSILNANAMDSLDNAGCAVYFTGIGCPYCANADPILFKETVPDFNVLVIEYEIYQKQVNAPLLNQYYEKYGIALGIPQLLSNAETFYVGEKKIVGVCEECSDSLSIADEYCILPDKTIKVSELDFDSVIGQPTFWYRNKVLFKQNQATISNDLIRKLLVSKINQSNIDLILNNTNINYDFIKPKDIPLSGSKVEFDNALEVGGWVLQWKDSETITPTATNNNEQQQIESTKQELTLIKVISLAAVDAINPCALAVLTMILIAIISYNPRKRKNILYAGLAFALAVVIMYMAYGLIIIKFFQLVQAITSIRIILYKVLGVIAVMLGVLQIKDFFKYKAGTIGTEMPLSMRPKVKKLISKVTSPKGAFIIGLFVTLFLLPCTIGPYVIMGGILSAFEIIKTIPTLLLYNLIFILPIIIITLIVYFGLKKTADISEWKDKNIKILHLVAGIVMFLLGIAMFFGLL